MFQLWPSNIRVDFRYKTPRVVHEGRRTLTHHVPYSAIAQAIDRVSGSGRKKRDLPIPPLRSQFEPKGMLITDLARWIKCDVTVRLGTFVLLAACILFPLGPGRGGWGGFQSLPVLVRYISGPIPTSAARFHSGGKNILWHLDICHWDATIGQFTYLIN